MKFYVCFALNVQQQITKFLFNISRTLNTFDSSRNDNSSFCCWKVNIRGGGNPDGITLRKHLE